MRGRHEKIDVHYISQSYLGLPRQSIRNNIDRIILFKQTLGDVECILTDIGGYDKEYGEFKEMRRNVWIEKNYYRCIDMIRNKTRR